MKRFLIELARDFKAATDLKACDRGRCSVVNFSSDLSVIKPLRFKRLLDRGDLRIGMNGFEKQSIITATSGNLFMESIWM